MNSATPALLALLLVLSVPAMTVTAAGPADEMRDESLQALQESDERTAPVNAEGTTNRLPLTGEIESGYAESDPDLGTVLASRDDELRVDHEQFVLVDDEFADASVDERARRLDAAYARVKERIDALEEREREAVRAHAAGERSDRELLQVLIRNRNEAAALSDARDDLEDRADRIPGYTLTSTEDADNTKLGFHQGSLRDRLALSTEAIDDRTKDLLIQTSQNGYRLSVLDGQTYTIETVRFDNRDTGSSDQFRDLGEALDHAVEFYPWADEKPESSKNVGSTAENLYTLRITLENNNDQVEVYMDGGTGQIYREVQELSINSLPVANTETRTDDGLNLTINETPLNGPAEVTVTDSATGEPETATITVDGYELGETDEDGTLWFVPPGDSYELGAATQDRSLSATVSAGE